MARKLIMPRKGRQSASTAAFVCGSVFVVYAKGKGRIMIKKEARDVIIIHNEDDVCFDRIKPTSDFAEILENWPPCLVVV